MLGVVELGWAVMPSMWVGVEKLMASVEACARSHSNQHWLEAMGCESVNALKVFSARRNFVALPVCERFAST